MYRLTPEIQLFCMLFSCLSNFTMTSPKQHSEQYDIISSVLIECTFSKTQLISTKVLL